ELERLVDVERGELGGVERQFQSYKIIFRIRRLPFVDLVVDLLHPVLQARDAVVEGGASGARPLEEPVGARDVEGDVLAILVDLRARHVDARLGRGARRFDLAEGVERLDEVDAEVEGDAVEGQHLIARSQIDDAGLNAVGERALLVAAGAGPRLVRDGVEAAHLGRAGQAEGELAGRPPQPRRLRQLRVGGGDAFAGRLYAGVRGVHLGDELGQRVSPRRGGAGRDDRGQRQRDGGGAREWNPRSLDGQ